MGRARAQVIGSRNWKTTAWLAAILALGAVLRWHGLGRHFFWFDEGLLLDIDQLSAPFGRYVLNIWRTTTYNPGWAAVVWVASRLGGTSLLAARFPSFLAGVLCIAALFATARALRLDRPTALAAALLGALAWPQVEYSQQILPYAAIPLLTCLLLWSLAGLAGRERRNVSLGRKAHRVKRAPHFLARGRRRWAGAGSAGTETAPAQQLGARHSSRLDPSPEPLPEDGPRTGAASTAGSPPRDRTSRSALALAAVGTVAVVNHNSALMLLPFLGLVAAGCVFRRNAPEGLARRVLVVGGSLAWVALVALVFYLPKRGEGYREYLNAYYTPTFTRQLATDGPAIYYAPFLDRVFHHAAPHPGSAVAALYFGLTRAYDVFLYSVNLFCPDYVTPAWGFASAIPVGLALAGLVAALRARRGPVVRLIGVALVATLVLLFLLSTVRLYPFGGIRQLLFLSPIILLLAAIGWRSTLRRWPQATWTLSALVILLYALRLPVYESATRARLDERALLSAIRATGIRTVVAADFGEHYFVLNQMLRNVMIHELLETSWPRSGSLLYHREPLLLFSAVPLEPGDFQGRSAPKSVAYRHLLPGNPDFSAYEVTPLLAHQGGPFRGGQPNPGAFLYRLKPRPGLPPVTYRPLVQAVTPPDGSQQTTAGVSAVELAFSSPIAPRKLHGTAIELLVRTNQGPGAPSFAPVPTALTFSDSDARGTLRPKAPLAPGLYLIKVDDTVEDRDGFRREKPFYASFELIPAQGEPSAQVAKGGSRTEGKTGTR